MRKGCRLARTFLPLMLWFSLLAGAPPSTAFSKGRGSNARAGVNDVDDNLGNPNPDPDYCMERTSDTGARAATYNFGPNTLNNKDTRLKRAAMLEGPTGPAQVKKRSFGQFKDKFGRITAESGPEAVALALSDKESSKYAQTMENSRLNSDHVQTKYADQDISRMYDDFEARDLVKQRGLLLGEEYGEMNDGDELSDNNLTEETAQVEDDENAETNSEESKEEDSWDARSKDSKRIEGELARIDESKGGLDSKRSAGYDDQSGLGGDADPNSLKDAKVYEAELKETTGETDHSKKSETSKRTADFYGDYEKRAELEIERKVDAIKQEIKREIEQNQRLREIEENNAKFDQQLRTEDNADQEDSPEGASVEKRQTGKGRAAERSKTILPRHHPAKFNKRSLVKNVINEAKRKGSGGRGHKSARSRRVARVSASPVKKREYLRQVILVKHAADTRKKKRSSDTSGRNAEASVGALGKEANENKQRLAPDYNEAFGGLQADPRASLARYKRIKRVLRVPT